MYYKVVYKLVAELDIMTTYSQQRMHKPQAFSSGRQIRNSRIFKKQYGESLNKVYPIAFRSVETADREYTTRDQYE